METFILILCIFSMLKQGVLSEIKLTESGKGAINPEESLRLTCAVSGTSITDTYGYHWIRQPPNKGLEWVGMGYYSSSSTWYTNYASAFQSRVFISPDTSKNEFSLQLNSLTAADTAVYYCARQAQLTERVLSEIQLTESGKGTVKPGESLRLTCKVSGTSITDEYSYHWIRQLPNKGLEWIGEGYYRSSTDDYDEDSIVTWNTNYASAFQSRVSITPDDSKNEFSLQLNSLTAEDTAVYYCAREPQ
ncbi:UNVERIFIED_CONTAM: hypothetical protein K2H54_044030 [Gekko kuhli]